jgi:Acetyltransferase (GNAT) domain
MQFEELQLIETTQKEKMQFRYVFVKKLEITVGVIYFQIVRFTGNDLINYFPEEPVHPVKKYAYKIFRGIAEPLIKTVDVKLLVSGNVFMTGENGFYFNNEVSLAQRAALLRKAIKETAKTDGQIKAVLVGDLYEPKTEFDSSFKKRGYHEITVEADMSLPLKPEWKTLNDYISAMSSKYRVRAKKVFALCKENGVLRKDLSVEEIAQYENELFVLYNMVISRAEFKLASLTKDFFRAQKELMGEQYRVFAYFKGDVMIGFISLFKTGKKMEVHYTGMNKDVTRQINLYQHMLYDMVEFGIQNGAEKLHFGRTAPEIKSTVGAAPSPMYGYVKHFNPAFNFLMVRTFTASLKPPQYVIRSPFNKGAKED